MGHKKSQKKHSSSSSIVPDYSSKCSTKSSTVKCCKKPEPKPCHKCDCDLKYYFPLPNLPTQPVSERVTPVSWLAPGSVQACCSICSTVQPVYANPCNTCRYDKGTYPINNTAYFNTYEYNA
jgi:hypothetical protein